MKKHSVVAIVLALVLFVCNSFSLADESIAITTVPAVVTGLSVLADNTFLAHIVECTTGRSGIATSTGAKGIVFEQLYVDMLNLLPGVQSAALSASPTDSLADVAVTYKNGITELIQCKDGTSASQIYKILARYKSGYYDGATLVGTKETAALVNEAATKQGLGNIMKSTNISTKTTSKVAERITIPSSAASVLQTTVRKTEIGMAIGAVYGLIESLVNGADYADTTANVTVDALQSGVTFAVSSFTTQCVAPALVAALGVGGTAAAPILSGVAIIIIPMAAGYTLKVVIENTELKQKVANLTRDTKELVVNLTDSASDRIQEMNIGEKISLFFDDAKQTAQDFSGVTMVFMQNLGDNIVVLYGDTKEAVTQALNAAQGWLGSAAENAKAYVIDASSNVKIYLAEKGAAVKETAVNTVDDITQFIANTSGAAWSRVVDTCGNAWTFVKDVPGKISDAVDGPTKQVSAFVEGLFAE